jgi:DNA-binding CsgD family transcriptional regulator/tetratricopeptide (TPR) repeat protein
VRHAEAARMLADEGADPDVVCLHLLAAEATGSRDVVSRLRAAADRAQSSGRSELAMRYLTRALQETADADTRRRVRHELGQAARVVRDRDAAEHVRLALGLCEDLDERAAIANDLSEVLLFAGAREAARQAVDESTPDDAIRIAVTAYDTRWVGEFDGRVDRLIAAALEPGCAALSGVLSGVLAWRGEASEVVRGLLTRCVGALARAAWHEGDALPVGQALLAYSFLEDFSAARALVGELRCVARSRGSVGAAALAAAHGALLHARAGALADAEADLRALVELDGEHAVSLLLPLALCLAADALLERPELAVVLAAITAREVPDETVEGAMLHELRGRLALACGNGCDARLELETAAATYDALRLCSSRTTSWRCTLALALGLDGEDRSRAAELAHAALADARRAQSPRAIGVALRTLGLLEPGPQAIGYLEQAVAILEPSAARLEHARALVDLGAALRRANRRAAARAPLRAGLECAELCGALRLRERALVELHATGARPRRSMLSGPASLTTAERRVAELAVAGLTNPEIAQTLFVTINTVEGHLRHVYQKLSIHSRRQLPDALRDDVAA